MIHFKFVGIKDMHNIYYLGLSGERSLPFGLLVLLIDLRAFFVNFFDEGGERERGGEVKNKNTLKD